MSATLLTRDGRSWTPRYLERIDYDLCIGCGRCYKACGQGVLSPIDKPVDDEDDDGEETITMVMSVSDPGACIGCEACARACPRKAHTHVVVAA